MTNMQNLKFAVTNLAIAPSFSLRAYFSLSTSNLLLPSPEVVFLNPAITPPFLLFSLSRHSSSFTSPFCFPLILFHFASCSVSLPLPLLFLNFSSFPRGRSLLFACTRDTPCLANPFRVSRTNGQRSGKSAATSLRAQNRVHKGCDSSFSRLFIYETNLLSFIALI